MSSTLKEFDQHEKPHSLTGGIEHKAVTTVNNESSDDIYFDALEEFMQNDQYYNAASYGLIKNSEIFQNKQTLALALYNQPSSDKIEIRNKPKSEWKDSEEFKLVKFELHGCGYTAKLESGKQVMTIIGKNAYIVIPDFMDPSIKRKEDKRENVNKGIPGYYDDNPAIKSEVKFNVMVMLDTAVNIDDLFKVDGSWYNPIASGKRKVLSTAKERGTSAGYHVSSEQKDYTKFTIGASTFKIEVNKKRAINYYKGKKYHPGWVNSLIKALPALESIIGAVYSTIVKILSQSCKEKIKVDKEGNLELNLAQKNILINGEILNQARDIAFQGVANVGALKGGIETEQGIDALSNIKTLEGETGTRLTQEGVLINEEIVNEKVERQEYLLEKLKYAAKQFGKAATTSEYSGVPKEQQLSIDLGNKKIFGIINRILRWIESKFTYFFTRYNLFPEVGTRERKVPRTNTKVKYFTPNEQAEHALYIGEENGDLKLYDLEGKLYDTTDKVSKGKKGCVAYVLTLDGRLITHEHINPGKGEYAYRHSTLAGGKPVICSGLVRVIGGKITYIDNNSGHYKPEAANMRNAVEKFKELFSENAKVVCFGYFNRLLKQIPFIRKIPIPTKKESVENFLDRMEEQGEDGLTEYERYFAKVKKDNQEYANQLDCQSVYTKVASSNYEPIPISDSSNPREVKMTIEHSIRKIIGAGYGHKPKIDVEHYNEEICGVSVTFHYKDDRSRFIEVLDSEQCNYISRIHGNKYKITMSTEQAHELIKNTLQIKIDSIKQLDTITRGYSSRSA